MKSSRLTADEWLLTEATRLHEETVGRRKDDEAANRLASAAGPDSSARLLARARALPGAIEACADLAQLRRLLRYCLVSLVLLGALAGLVAARAIGSGRDIDFLLASLTLAGLPGLMLALWLFMLLASRRIPGAGGRLAASVTARLGPRLLNSALAGELLRAGSTLLRKPAGRWYMSSLSHAFWLAYGIGAWLSLVILFSFAQYEISWGTTLLSDAQMVALIGTLAAPVQALGLMPALGPDWIAAGREGVALDSMRADWARFLLGSVLIYTAAPRALLLAVCAILARQAAARLELDLKQAGYLRLLPLIRPSSEHSSPLGPSVPASSDHPWRPPGPSAGPLVLVGIELADDGNRWPPELPGLSAQDLGLVKDRSSMQAMAAALQSLAPRPRALLVACSLERTPDSGTAERLARLADAGGSSLIVLLVDRQRLVERGAEIEARLADWTELARRCGGRAVLIDELSNSPDGAGKLAQWLAAPA